MKRTKLFIGAAVLTVGAIAVSQANSKFAKPTKLYYTVSGTCKVIASSITGVGANFTTNATVGAEIRIATVSGAKFRVYAATVSGACSKPVHTTGL